MPFAPVGKSAVLARLAEGHAARATVVTPNARLARELSREFDAGQAAKGLAVWETADILPLTALVERLYEDALYSGLAAKLPLLLTDAQAQSLWEAAIRESRWGEALLAVPQAAGEAARAWALAQGWRIDGALASFPGNDDAKAFAEWAKDYARRSSKAGATDRARLADVVAPLTKEDALRKPALLVLYAFDELKPQDRDFLEACEKAGIELRACAPERRGGEAAKQVFPSAREELDAVAQWARAKLEAGATRIGIVVPQLGERRKEVARVLARTLHPGHNLPGEEARVLPFNISLGAPLDDYPVAKAALSILELSTGEIPFEQASRLIRSPFIAGASPEMAPRALLDARLRRSAPAKLGLGKLIALVEGAPVLRQALEKLFAIPRLENASPHAWARHFTTLLDAVGFPGDRPLDSAEHQARAKFNEQLAELAKLERVAPKLSLGRALASLRRLCADTLFQPESPDAPIQVLGVLESLGLEFDALWVSGLTDEAWPMHTRANPFIPPALQRKAGIREASPEATLEWAKKVTEGWLGAANEVVMSYPAREGDRDLLASPLISGVSSLSETPETMRVARYRDAIFAKRVVVRVADGKAPPLATKTPRGGTRILADQAECPFRAFARHRLGAEALEEPVEGLDARARGLLLHTLMKELWTSLKGSNGLDNPGPAIEKAAKAAVAEAKLDEPFASLERARLAKLASEWLDVERERSPFTVVAMEEKRKLTVAGLGLNGRIDRLDRLESGGHAVIDYKTGNPTPNDWQGERPEDPQLPLYALSAKEEISAVAYAKLKTGAMRFMGFSRAKDAIPKVKIAENWATLFEGWKQELEALGEGFASGDARVDPKKLLSTCRYCDLQPLCRVYERVNALEESGEEG